MIRRASFLRSLTIMGAIAAASLVQPTTATTGDLSLSLGPKTASATIVEKIVAVIGTKAIFLSELKERCRPFLVKVYSDVPEGPQRAAAVSQVYKVVLDRMIEEELETAAAARMGIVVTSSEIDDAQSRVAEQNGISEGQLLAEAKRSGLTISQYRDEVRRQVLQMKLQSFQFQGRIRITENDLRAAYSEVARQERMRLNQRTARMLLPLGTTSAEKRRNQERAQEIAARARSGESFISLIAEYGSPGSGLAQPGPPGAEPPIIQRATMNLEPGQISAPFPVAGHLMIVTVIERAPSQLPDYEQLKGQLENQVYMQKLQSARQHWLDGLRRRTHVEVRL